MRVAASTSKNGEHEHATTESVLAKEKSGELAVPFTTLSGIESIACGFRMEMFSLTDEKGNAVGGVDSGAGLGTDFLLLKWGKQTAMVRGLDLLKAWLKTADPDAIERLP